ncbi:rhomboid family intramembrane serine protease [Endozoicomonas sp. G2_1]|uniref:rhomboid family intramembrane serine protease n=1 Tax=Endozoicomonas sp. G2_1 TaxID=2821091 RepID=UPI0024691BDC|nr:rhomboid family intramembrane serine protease [Endozoicomonas sp. G2_1]
MPNCVNIEYLFTAPYNLLSPIFFHTTWLHILFNSILWWQLAGSIETYISKRVLVILLVASSSIPNLTQFLVIGPNFAGISGVIYALVGYIWWINLLDNKAEIYLPKAVIVGALIWLAMGFIDMLPVMSGNAGHLAGLICGCLIALIDVKTSLVSGKK